MAKNKSGSGVIDILFENSLFLIGGTIAALFWANFDLESYHHFVHFTIFTDPLTLQTIDLHFLVNDFLMCLFFAIAGKEVWEAFLPGGVLSSARTAATPLLATLGGMIGPALIFLGGVYLFDPQHTYARGWAIPMATDIAFSYLFARFIFGPSHPAIAFLLLLAIADDAGGLIVLAVAYPQKPLSLGWLGLTLLAIILCVLCRKLRLQSFWWYLVIPGLLAWYSFYRSGIHPALGLIPIIPFIPHAYTDLGIFAREELGQNDPLNAFEHWWKNPVELVLGLFGLVNAGVAFGNLGLGTYLVLAGLLIGKPLGIVSFTWIGQKFLGLQLPEKVRMPHVWIIGLVAALGFTVALFVCTAAFPVKEFDPEIVDSVKMGALASFIAGFIAWIVAKIVKVRANKEN